MLLIARQQIACALFACLVISLSQALDHGLKFKSISDYIGHLKTVSTLPKGFSVGATRFMFSPMEVNKQLPMNLTIIKLDQPTDSFAAMFTSNKFPGGPVVVGKERLLKSKQLQAVVINNKISNVCPGGVSDRGVGDSEEVCQAVADKLQLKSKDLVFPSSTGIIGWRLPVQAIKDAVPVAVEAMQTHSALPAALGITTTDRYPKVRSVMSNKNTWRIVGIAKGAGMIEPNMATMLCYIMTDRKVSKDTLEKCLRSSVAKSFNTISIDGDQSTSDTVLALSSNAYDSDASEDAEFQCALESVCANLAEDIVRNGEGTQHVIKVKVTGAPSDIFARDLGRFVTNSNLVKCAIYGCDPNVGRIVGAVGSYLGTISDGEKYTKGLTVFLNGQKIFDNGAFSLNPDVENILSESMLKAQLYPNELPEHERNYPPHTLSVDIDIVMNYDAKMTGSCTVIGSDLTREYVDVNADYRS